MRPLITISLFALALTPTLEADVVTDWNQTLLQAIRTTSQPPPRASRQMAMMHVAMYDAINGLYGTHRPYHVTDQGPEGASDVASASAAAKVVLDSFFSGNATASTAITARYTADLAALPDNQAKSDGIAWGTSVGQAILALRANDGATASVTYTQPVTPGIWRPTPPANAAALLPQWPQVRPFGLVSGSQFRPMAPPALSTYAYEQELKLTQTLGSAASATRTADQTEVALFWSDGGGTETPPGHWMSIARGVATQRGLSLTENARLFALLGMTVADAAIAAWDAKFAYNYWRPITAIREADNDTNPNTTGDTTWAPLISTPPFPEYTSGHSTFSRSSATILALFLGTDQVTFTTSSDGLPAINRTYSSFSSAAEDAGMSRIFGGIHFPSANITGQNTGYQIGQFIFAHYLRPMAEPSFTLVTKQASVVTLQANMPVDVPCKVEASSDLESWEKLTEITSATGRASIVDPTAPAGQRYYRIKEL